MSLVAREVFVRSFAQVGARKSFLARFPQWLNGLRLFPMSPRVICLVPKLTREMLLRPSHGDDNIGGCWAPCDKEVLRSLGMVEMLVLFDRAYAAVGRLSSFIGTSFSRHSN